MSDRSVHPETLAGDGFAYAGGKKGGRERAPNRTTRHHRCDEAFVELLEEDFGIAFFALSSAFLGAPAEPQKGAIAICEWASQQDQPEKALLAWARKNGRGVFRPDYGDDK